MKSVTIFVTVGIIIVIIVVAALVIRSNQESALPIDETGDNGLEAGTSEFVETVPSQLPTPLTTSPSPSVSSSPSPSAAGNASQTISITDSGFSPSKITVPAGTTLTFTNNGQALHWPASDLHPTHQLLPGFDARRGLTTGETYSFTFTKTGDWSMHDHLNPSSTGTITVQ